MFKQSDVQLQDGAVDGARTLGKYVLTAGKPFGMCKFLEYYIFWFSDLNMHHLILYNSNA